MKALTATILLLASCGGHHTPKPAEPSMLVPELRTRYAGWLAELHDKSSIGGWPSATDCDSALWAGEALAAGATVDLSLAEWAPGEIHRRPKVSGECYPKDSASTVSNDMLAGYMWGLWKSRDLGAAERLWSYGSAHGWKMGQGDSRSILSPAGAGRLARLVSALGGKRDPMAGIPDPCLPVDADYEHHLQVIGIVLDGEMAGGISDGCNASLTANARIFPPDGLFAAARGVYSGDMGPALSLLTSDGYQCPGYVRGAASYCLVHEAFAAKLVLDRYATGAE